MVRTATKIEWSPYLATQYAEGYGEGENATYEEQMEAWAYIIKHSLWRSLQGWYGRTANDLIENGYIDRKGNIDWELLKQAS